MLRKTIISIPSVLSLILLAGSASARPVSYQGGWTLIQETDRQSSALWGHYTVDPKWSLGWRSEWDRQDDIAFHGPQATYLARRWFGENYQANLYGFAAVGIAEGVGDNPAAANGAVMGGILADWETRRYFLSYKARGFEAGDLDKSFAQAARIGIAPYIGETDDLHTWIMVELDHRPENKEPVGVTPLLRFFKGAALFEAGWSLTDDEPLLNFTYRF